LKKYHEKINENNEQKDEDDKFEDNINEKNDDLGDNEGNVKFIRLGFRLFQKIYFW